MFHNFAHRYFMALGVPLFKSRFCRVELLPCPPAPEGGGEGRGAFDQCSGVGVTLRV